MDWSIVYECVTKIEALASNYMLHEALHNSATIHKQLVNVASHYLTTKQNMIWYYLMTKGNMSLSNLKGKYSRIVEVAQLEFASDLFLLYLISEKDYFNCCYILHFV